MALQDATRGSSACSVSPGASLACSNSVLSETMPWEWILENLLDLREISLSFLQEVISYIPHIKEPRCSRLLQKVALRYLDEVVVSRRVDVCDVPLIRFISKEQGVSNLRRIHSLKESFENDLILRVETEAVLTSLRCGSEEGGKDWEAFEEAVDIVFPEDLCEPRAVERRKELIAVLPDRLRRESENDLCDQLLGKYPLQELLRDITHFVEDKRKFFKIKFLDQLTKDVHNGVYVPSSTLESGVQRMSTPPTTHKDCAGDSQASDIILSRQETLMQKKHNFVSRIEAFEVVPGITHDFTDPAVNVHHATYLPGSTAAMCGRRVATHEDDVEVCKRAAGANVAGQEDLRAEMSCRIAEVDKVAAGLTNEINELVHDITKFAEDVHKAACIPEAIPCLGNQQISNLETTIARDPVLIQKDAEVVFSVQRTEGDTDIDRPAEDHMESKRHVDNHGHNQSEFLKGCRVGDTLSSIAPTFTRAHTDKVTKRSANEIGDQFMGPAKKVKCDDSEEESEGQKEQEKQNKQSSATDDIELRLHPIGRQNDGEGPPSEGRLSRGSEDIAAEMDDVKVSMMDKNGGRCRTRIYLGRISKEGPFSHKNVGVTSDELRQPVAGGGEHELNANCCLCKRSGGFQAFCHGCPVSVHECCLSKLCMAQAAADNCWYCFTCSATMAQDGVKKAKVDVKKAKEALKKAEEEALKTEKMLAAFLSASEEWSREHHQLLHGLVEHRKGTHFGNSEGKPKGSSKAMYMQQGSTRSQPGREERNISSNIEPIMETEVRMSGSALHTHVDPDAMRQASLQGKETKMQTTPQPSLPSEELDAVRSNSATSSMFPREAIDRQASASAPSLPVMHSDEQRFGTGGRDQSGRLKSLTELLPTTPMTSSADQTHTKSGIHERINDDAGGANITASNASMVRSDSAHLSNDPQLNMVNPGGEEGDGHDGDLEEVCEDNKADADGNKVTEPAVGGEISEHISNVPDVEERPRRRQVYRGRRQIPGVRRRNLPWTENEELVLKEGVKMFSSAGEWGFQWNRILQFGEGKFHESRTAVDLKDKWRNMMRKAGVLSSDISS